MHFATIITESYLGYACALADSLAAHAESNCELHCLVVDSSSRLEKSVVGGKVTIRYYEVKDIEGCKHFDLIRQKYYEELKNAFRWSMKPVFVSFLLTQTLREPVAFVDGDQFFAGDPHAIFKQLENSRFLLSPHDRPIDPSVGKMFHTNFTGGFFNGGLFVARPDALDVLEWWAHQCSLRCEINPDLGLYADQKYLDAVPTNFHNTDWIRHRGVNVASWNIETRKRELAADGSVSVDGDPLICVHFTGSTIRMIDFGGDPCLVPVLERYRKALSKHGLTLPVSQKKKQDAKRHAHSSGLARLRSWFPQPMIRYAKMFSGKS